MNKMNIRNNYWRQTLRIPPDRVNGDVPTAFRNCKAAWDVHRTLSISSDMGSLCYWCLLRWEATDRTAPAVWKELFLSLVVLPRMLLTLPLSWCWLPFSRICGGGEPLSNILLCGFTTLWWSSYQPVPPCIRWYQLSVYFQRCYLPQASVYKSNLISNDDVKTSQSW